MTKKVVRRDAPGEEKMVGRAHPTGRNMNEKKTFCVLRLNAETFVPGKEEREILDAAGLKVCKIEGERDEEILEHAEEADAVMIVSAYLRTHVIEKLKRCRIISRLGTGYDKIDVRQATKQGIYVTNVPHFSTNEVADHTMALLLCAARHIKDYETLMRTGHRPNGTDGIHRLAVQTMGLVGFGRIGKAVAKRAKAFGLKVLAYDPMLTASAAEAEGVTATDLETLLRTSDFVCMMCPLMDSTRGMMTMEQFKKMKPSAVFVNTARGELVNENDLVRALKEKVIRYAAIDVYGGINVFLPGGFATDHPYFGVGNIVMTPHCSANSEEAAIESVTTGARAVVDVLTGKKPMYPVNPEVKPWFVV
jgi:D-3-phosphoglycerate dehydrogenase